MATVDDAVIWNSFNHSPNPTTRAPVAGTSALAVSLENTSASQYAYLHERKGHQWVTKFYDIGAALTQDGCGIAYNGSAFVIYPTNGTSVKSSPDGKVWTTRTLSESIGSGLNKLAAIAGVFVGVNSTTTGTRSVDGATWADVTFPAAFERIFSIGTTFLGMTTNTAGVVTYYTSTDGTNWTARTTPAAISVANQVLYVGANSDAGSDGVYFHTGAIQDASGFCMYSSTDGITWTRRGLPYMLGAAVNNYVFRSSYGCGGIWCKSSTGISTYYSGDGGATWRASATGAAVTVQELAFCGFYNANGSLFYNCVAEFVGYDTALNFGSKAAVYSRIQ